METQISRLIEQVLALPPADKERVRQALAAEQPVGSSGPISMALLQQLHAAGLISEIKQPTMTSEEYRSFHPVASSGTPTASEMIIEDRR